ncbi:HD-GYP domain-containing protein [Desulfitobacterium sp. Sab5]|uniref:HD-GYP domain-containing protein n=1 Tax=Desulfitobacterium TaxID=36853 RepID=UPI003CE73142
MYGQEIQQLLKDLAWVDDVTYYHSLKVAFLMSRFAETLTGKLMIKQAWVTRNEWVATGLLHDIGKLRWPREVLFSTTLLKDMEIAELSDSWRYIVEHPLASEKIILEFYERTGNRFWERIAKGVAAHHENYMGGGYPYKLKGTEIPLLARGLQIFDRFAALTGVKRYRMESLESPSAIKEMQNMLGCIFDPYWGERILDFLAGVEVTPNLDDWITEEMKNFD